jgi:predicted anti-sigma-YlaC factor YlaD
MEAHHQQSAICERARSWISLRVDDELSEFECALLDAHLTRCDACADFAEDVGSMTFALRTEPLESLSRPLAVPSRRRRNMALPARAAASAAALLVTIGGAFAVLGHSGPQPLASHSARVNNDLRLLRASQRQKLTAVFEQTETPVVHPKGAPSRPAGGPVRNVLPGQSDVSAGR